jgi:hypothetical protein
LLWLSCPGNLVLGSPVLVSLPSVVLSLQFCPVYPVLNVLVLSFLSWCSFQVVLFWLSCSGLAHMFLCSCLNTLFTVLLAWLSFNVFHVPPVLYCYCLSCYGSPFPDNFVCVPSGGIHNINFLKIWRV